MEKTLPPAALSRRAPEFGGSELRGPVDDDAEADSCAAAGVPASEPGVVGDFRPVFVVGNPRSGTTLLTAMLGRNSRVASLPELHYMRNVDPVVDLMAGRGPAEVVAYTAAMPWLRQLSVDWDTVAARLDRFPAITSAALFQSILVEFMATRGASAVVEKTPLHLRYIPALVRYYPGCRVVWIVRHSAGCVNSLKRLHWAVGGPLRLAMLWNRNINLGLRYARRFPEHVMTVRYEDLLRDPEKELRRINAWVGLPFEPAQLEAQRQTEVVASFEHSWKYRVNQALAPDRAEAWAGELTPEERAIIARATARNLRRLGYTPDPAGTDRQAGLRARVQASVWSLVDRVVLSAPMSVLALKSERAVSRLKFRLARLRAR